MLTLACQALWMILRTRTSFFVRSHLLLDRFRAAGVIFSPSDICGHSAAKCQHHTRPDASTLTSNIKYIHKQEQLAGPRCMVCEGFCFRCKD